MEPIFEPFKIKMVEPLPILNEVQRTLAIKKVDYNLFLLPADQVTFDLLTDSGTSAMSSYQWAGMMIGDESYAGSTSFKKFESVVQNLTGIENIIPTHQGRSAEALLMKALAPKNKLVLGNTHFDTTRANIEAAGAQAVDLPSKESKDSSLMAPFKGDIDLQKLRSTLKESSHNTALIIMTVTNNSIGGQPVSMRNLKEAQKIAHEFKIPLFLDAARFAENCFFIKTREEEYAHYTIEKIAHEMFSLVDGVLMSAKKDAFANIGGFLALRDLHLAKEIRNLMVITEGFPTYGGLAGRDLEALAIGLREIIEEPYLTYRIRSTAYLGEGIEAAGLKVVKPFGGHAVYIDAGTTLSHIEPLQFPGQSLSIFIYEKIGIRSVEVGSVMLGTRDKITGEELPAPKELVRLAIPRRVYTQSHVDYMIEKMKSVATGLKDLRGYSFLYQAPQLRHFTARFKRL